MGPEPEAVLPVVVLVAVEGLEGGLLVGGALAPLVDWVRVGARGLVSGFGRIAPLEEVIFVAVLDGWSGLPGRLAPIAGNFRGWSEASSSSSMMAFLLRLLVGNAGPASLVV